MGYRFIGENNDSPVSNLIIKMADEGDERSGCAMNDIVCLFIRFEIRRSNAVIRCKNYSAITDFNMTA